MARSHLNGSVNLGSAEEVFRLAGAIAGRDMACIPDGETSRKQWVTSLVPMIAQTPGLVRLAPRRFERVDREFELFGLAEGTSAEDLDFASVDFSTIPRQSYATFRRLRDEGAIPSGTRFMVAMATPAAVVCPHFAPELVPDLIDRMAIHQRREIARIAAAIPHDDLAFQWDVAVEVWILEGAFPAMPPIPFDAVCAQLGAIASFVPEDVSLGYHLCYGDAAYEPGQTGKHFKQPADLGLLVRMANAITAAAGHPVDWFTMPVPIDRDDDAYFRALGGLDTGEAEIYLGLVHHEDGLAGSQRRADVARRHLPRFGVCTECGMGRKPPEAIQPLLEIQRDLVVPAGVAVPRRLLPT